MTTAALNARAEEIIRGHGAIPTFLGYPHTGKNDFPASICASINEELVHGIPNDKRVGWSRAISSVSTLEPRTRVGLAIRPGLTPVETIDEESQRLLEATEGSLWAGIAQARAGNRLGDISKGR